MQPSRGFRKLVQTNSLSKNQKVGMTPEELEEATSLDGDAEYAPSDSELSDESDPSDDEKTHRAKKLLFDGFKKSGREVQTNSGDDLIFRNRCRPMQEAADLYQKKRRRQEKSTSDSSDNSDADDDHRMRHRRAKSTKVEAKRTEKEKLW